NPWLTSLSCKRHQAPGIGLEKSGFLRRHCFMAETILPASIVEETRHRYLTYALSVITSRALPDVRDGLKPVQRRILYCMYHELSLHFDRRPVKCARIAGDVIGKYHPHSTEAAYDALVRM